MNQLLRDADVQPTDAHIAKGLGDAFHAFKMLKEGLETHGVTLMEWRYYNDGKAWLTKGEYKWKSVRGARKVKPIFWLSIWEGFFKVSFFFSFDVKDDLLRLLLSGDAKASIEHAQAMGKTMRFMPIVLDITSDAQLGDVYELVQFKKSI